MSNQVTQILTCFSLYSLAEDAGALIVLGSDCQCMQLSTPQPGKQIGRLVCGEVGTGSAIFFRLDDVGNTTFRTRIPAYCDVIVPASCHSSQPGRWADD